MPEAAVLGASEPHILRPLILLRELLLLQIDRLIHTLEEELEDNQQQELKHLQDARRDVRRRLNEQRIYTSILVWAHAEITEYDLLLRYARDERPEPPAPGHQPHPLVDAITDILRDLTNSTLQALEDSEQDMDRYLDERYQLLREYLTFNGRSLGNIIVETFENLSQVLQQTGQGESKGQLERAQERLGILHREIVLQSRKMHESFTAQTLAQQKNAQMKSHQRLRGIRQRLRDAGRQDLISQGIQERLASAALEAQECFDKVISESVDGMAQQTDQAFQRYLRRLEHAHAHIGSLLKLSETAFDQTFQACRLLLDAKLESHQTARENQALSNAIQRDPLTQLHNRLALDEHFPRIHATTVRTGLQLYLLFLDLDGFKAVNDTLGHHAGDQVLQQTAERMRASCREGDMLCRLGGDEFVILAASRHKDDLAVLGKRLMEAIALPFNLGQAEASISVSIGIAIVRQADALHDVIKRADHAMYLAKKAGKNRFHMESDEPADG